MITKQHSHYLKFLAKGHNFLLLSDRHFVEFDNIRDEFNLGIQRVLNEDELDNLTNTLIQNNIDIVIVDFTMSTQLAIDMYNHIKSYNDRVVVIGILNSEILNSISSFLNKLDGLLFDNFTLQELKDKLFVNLSIFYAIKAIGVRDMKITSGSSKSNDELDKFFDTYEGQLLFVVDELVELNKSLKAGELSSELLNAVADNMLILADIFSKEEHINDVVGVFKDFAEYLKSLDLSKIDAQSLHAFDYLCAIVDDTNTYMMEMFVDRVFRDVYIFHHSFENNLGFMKSAISLKDEENDDSELEFF
jgi:response regulator RpfG family c-di-GMP phosphodiesterase